jgi:hypothetical protein
MRYVQQAVLDRQRLRQRAHLRDDLRESSGDGMRKPVPARVRR